MQVDLDKHLFLIRFGLTNCVSELLLIGSVCSLTVSFPIELLEVNGVPGLLLVTKSMIDVCFVFVLLI